MERYNKYHPERFPFSGIGEVYSFTIETHAPEGYMVQAPLILALIKLQEGPMVTAQITDVDASSLYIGMPVEMITRRLRDDGERGIIVYGYKFRPRFSSPTIKTI